MQGGDAPARTAGRIGGAVDEYLRFASAEGGGADAGAMGREHENTSEGIRKLSAALAQLVNGENDADARASFQRFRQIADRIQQDPASMRHADQVRDAFTRAADVIASLERVESPDRVHSAAARIDTDEPLLERDAVHNFFRESGRAIRSAARR